MTDHLKLGRYFLLLVEWKSGIISRGPIILFGISNRQNFIAFKYAENTHFFQVESWSCGTNFRPGFTQTERKPWVTRNLRIVWFLSRMLWKIISINYLSRGSVIPVQWEFHQFPTIIWAQSKSKYVILYRDIFTSPWKNSMPPQWGYSSLVKLVSYFYSSFCWRSLKSFFPQELESLNFWCIWRHC